MKITFDHSYPKLEDGKRKLDSNGKPITVFVYKVHGTAKELELYKENRIAENPDHYKEAEDGSGLPLYFSPRGYGYIADLQISPKSGKLFVNTSKIDMANSLIDSFGEVGRIMATEILKTSSPTPKVVAEPVAEDSADESDSIEG